MANTTISLDDLFARILGKKSNLQDQEEEEMFAHFRVCSKMALIKEISVQCGGNGMRHACRWNYDSPSSHYHIRTTDLRKVVQALGYGEEETRKAIESLGGEDCLLGATNE